MRTTECTLEQNSLSKYELNNIRGGSGTKKGTSGGGTSDMDEDILLYDPIPEKKQ
jgi:hypothetical protein